MPHNSYRSLISVWMALQQTVLAAVVATTASTTQSAHAAFTLPASADIGQPILPNIKDPKAVNAQSVCPGYTASHIQRTDYGFTGFLTMAGKACNVYGNDVKNLNLTVEYQSGDRLNVEIGPAYITSANQSYYILPEHLVQKPHIDSDAASTVPDNDLEFVWGNQPTFWFAVLRKSIGETLFSTEGSKLVFEDQFVEFKTPLPQNYNLYGLGETIHPLRLGNNFTKTMYAADTGDTTDSNLYGTHPIYYDTRYYSIDETTGEATYVAQANSSGSGSYTSLTHGLYYRNAHAHEILLQPDSLTWRTLGGNIDLYFYAGPAILDVATSYQQSAIGLPAMQQYFTFGYHQCRWGYENWTMVSDVVDNFEKFGIPLENIWTDIDYMSVFRDFTTASNRFAIPEGKKLLKKIHDKGLHYIPITDSAIYIPNPKNKSDAYETFTRGDAAKAFLTNEDGSLYIGAVWPGYTVFPDWLSAGAGDWWTNELTTFHKDLAFDGIWIDMSEASSFCVGSCGSGNLTLNPAPGGIGTTPICNYPEGFAKTNASAAASASKCLASESSVAAKSTTSSSTKTTYLRTTPTPGKRNINYPPYAINNIQGDLAVHAVSPNATHRDSLKTQEYDVHNLFGYGILNATYNALLKVFPGKRPFIIGRSTFAGSGKVAGHWGGDNTSLWYYMYYSIAQALSFSLFGIPMFGVDTCGFNGNTDEELCNRWMQLSAFFPFYRNHNTIGAISQEPYNWASVTEASKTAMAIRYQLLPYMYTLFYQAHTTGSTVMRAMAWEFPNDPTLAAAEQQFLLGPSLLITPVLHQGATSVQGVFPGTAQGTNWYDWYNQTAVSVPSGSAAQTNTTISAPLGHIPLFVRGGSILPMQEAALTTTAARKTPWSLLVALSSTGAAQGSLYVDDGASVTPSSTLNVDFVAGNGTLYATGRGTFTDNNSLANVTVLGVGKGAAVRKVQFNGQNVKSFTYNTETEVLMVTGLKSVTGKGAWNADWQLRWQ